MTLNTDWASPLSKLASRHSCQLVNSTRAHVMIKWTLPWRCGHYTVLQTAATNAKLRGAETQDPFIKVKCFKNAVCASQEQKTHSDNQWRHLETFHDSHSWERIKKKKRAANRLIHSTCLSDWPSLSHTHSFSRSHTLSQRSPFILAQALQALPGTDDRERAQEKGGNIMSKNPEL